MRVCWNVSASAASWVLLAFARCDLPDDVLGVAWCRLTGGESSGGTVWVWLRLWGDR